MRRSLLVIGWAVAAVPVLAAPAAADVVKLLDGSRLEGDIRRSDEGWIVTERGGKQTTIAFNRVASIEATPKGGLDATEQKLASLRRAAESMADAKGAIDRFKAFIDQNAGTAAAQKAKVDLAAWQERLGNGLVKVGEKWVTPDQRKEIEQQSTGVAADAARLIAQAKLRDAGPVLDRALADNPKNVAAWYLRGVLQYRQDQLPAAKKAFEEALGLLPDHAPALNNLAVVLFRQNAQPAALTAYDKALTAAPGDRRVLDNLAEALYALPEEQRTSTLTKKVVRHFNEQELFVQAKLKAQGLFRWGANWVTAAELEKLKKAEQDIQDKLTVMGGQFDELTTRLTRVDADIATNEKLIRRMELDSVGVAANGQPVRYPLPPSYYDIQRDLAALRTERAQDAAKQESLRRAAKQLRQQMTGPKYAGLQRLIEVEGAPLPNAAAIAAGAGVNAAAPATVPAAATAPDVPAVPPAPAPVTQPAAAVPVPPPAEPAPTTRPRVYIPPEKPSILDRRFDDPPGGGGGLVPPRSGLLDEGGPPTPRS